MGTVVGWWLSASASLAWWIAVHCKTAMVAVVWQRVSLMKVSWNVPGRFMVTSNSPLPWRWAPEGGVHAIAAAELPGHEAPPNAGEPREIAMKHESLLNLPCGRCRHGFDSAK